MSTDGFVGSGKLLELLRKPLSTTLSQRWTTLPLFDGLVVVSAGELRGAPKDLMETLFKHLKNTLRKLLGGQFAFEKDLASFLSFLSEYIEGFLPFSLPAEIVLMVRFLSTEMLEIIQGFGHLSGFATGGTSNRLLEILVDLYARFAECTFRMAKLKANHAEHFLHPSDHSQVVPLAKKLVEDYGKLCLSSRVLDQELVDARQQTVRLTISAFCFFSSSLTSSSYGVCRNWSLPLTWSSG